MSSQSQKYTQSQQSQHSQSSQSSQLSQSSQSTKQPRPPKSTRTSSTKSKSTKKEMSITDLIQQLQTTQYPLSVLPQIFHSVLQSPPPNSVYNALIAAFHRLTTPFTTPLNDTILMHCEYMIAILAVISIHQPSIVDLLIPTNHFGVLLPQLLHPIEIKEEASSLLSMISTDTPSSILLSLSSELKQFFALPTQQMIIPYLTLTLLSQMNVIVSLPRLPKCTSDDDLLMMLPLYTNVILRGSTQPIPCVDDMITPIDICIKHLPKTLQPLTDMLGAVMNYSNNAAQDNILIQPIMKILLELKKEMFSVEDWFDIRVLMLSICANGLYELNKTANVLSQNKVLLQEYVNEYNSLSNDLLNDNNLNNNNNYNNNDENKMIEENENENNNVTEKDNKILKSYLAVVICGFVMVNNNCRTEINVNWSELLELLEEFAAFQSNCGIMDETSQRRLIDAMETIEKLVDGSQNDSHSNSSHSSISISSKGLNNSKNFMNNTIEVDMESESEDDDGFIQPKQKKTNKSVRGMSIDSTNLDDIDCY